MMVFLNLVCDYYWVVYVDIGYWLVWVIEEVKKLLDLMVDVVIEVGLDFVYILVVLDLLVDIYDYFYIIINNMIMGLVY